MTLRFQPIDQTQAGIVAKWRYDPPYDVYDLGLSAPDDVLGVLLDPANAYQAIVDENGELAAFCCFGPDAQVSGGDYGAAALDLGLGMHPDLTGQGRGLTFVRAVLAFARDAFAPVALRVTIAAFNQRAIEVWTRAGFDPVQTFQRGMDGRAFVVLMLRPSSPTV